jgi:hypothetical protein
VASVPDQEPLAVHEVEFVLDQVSVDVPPAATLVGFAVKVTVGVPAGRTVTVTLAGVVPPAPRQDSV